MHRHRRIRSLPIAISALLAVALVAPVDDAGAARPKKPSVSKVAPAAGPSSGGTRVTIAGKNFGKVKAVTFGGTAGRSITVLSTSRLQVTAPRHTAGVIDVRVKTAAGWSKTTRADRFRYVAAPTVRRVSPPSGSTAGGNTVTITGTSFVGVRSVVFGKTRATKIRVTSEKSITARVPAGRAGTVNVRVVTAYGTSPVVAAGRYTYFAPALWRDVQTVSPRSGGLDDMSCVDDIFCAAVDENGAAVVFRNKKWEPAQFVDTAALTTVSCVSATFCLAGGTSGRAFTWDGTSWSPMAVGSHGAVETVACSSATVCFLSSAGEPGDSAELWRFDSTWRYEYPREPHEALACTVNGPCLFPVADVYKRFTTSDYFTTQAEAPARLATLACPSDDVCVGVSTAGASYRYDHGTWSGPTSIAAGSDLPSPTIDCATVDRCAVVSAGSVFSYDGTSWTQKSAPLPYPVGPQCASTVCLVFDSTRFAVVGVSGIDPVDVDPYRGGINDLDCATPTLCVAVGDGGRVAVRRGTTWTTEDVPATGYLNSVACPATNFCLAGGDAIATFDGTSWLVDPDGPDEPVVDVSCASATYCVAVSFTRAFVYADGTVTTHDLVSDVEAGAYVGCAKPRFCVVSAGGTYTTLTNRSWSTPATLGDGTSFPVSCASPTMCVAVSEQAVVHRWNGRAWGASTRLRPAGLSSFRFDVDCASSSACKVTDVGVGSGSSYRPGGVWSFNGTSWSAVQRIGLLPSRISCATTRFCVAADVEGHIQTYR